MIKQMRLLEKSRWEMMVAWMKEMNQLFIKILNFIYIIY